MLVFRRTERVLQAGSAARGASGKVERMKKIAVTVLNYNNWPDTIICVESLLRSNPCPDWIIIVDNASTNASVTWLEHWAAGNLDFFVRENHMEPARKPLHLYTPAERAAVAGVEDRSGIQLLRMPSNGGYAAGNNAGIRRALALGADAVWILNNDTIVSPDALRAMRDALFSKPRPGLCGSLVRYMRDKGRVQCRAGGYTNKWTGLSVLDGNREDVVEALREPVEMVERRINFIYGASVMASRDFLEDVGLLDDGFFLYSEEQDWAYRARRRFDFAYAPAAHVLHKEGGATGWSSTRSNAQALWHMARSRLRLTMKHVPYALPSVLLCMGYAFLRILYRRLFVRQHAVGRR